MNRKGSIEGLFLLMVIGFFVVIAGAVFLVGFDKVTNSLINIETGDSNLNVSDAAQKTFGNLNTGFKQIRWWSFMLILALAISIFISNALVKVNPVFFVFYVIVVIIAIVVAIILSVSYQGLLSSADILGTELTKWDGANFIFTLLPFWITFIGLIGGVLQFVNFGRLQDEGGGLV